MIESSTLDRSGDDAGLTTGGEGETAAANTHTEANADPLTGSVSDDGRTKRTWRWAAYSAAVALAVWCIAKSVIDGRALQRAHPEVYLGAAPLVGRNNIDGWDWRFGWGLVGAAIIAAIVIVAVWKAWCFRVRLRTIVGASVVAASAFAVSLALTDGADGVMYGAGHRFEYYANLQHTPPAATFLRTFIARIDDYSVHVRGHPPGFILVLKFVNAIGLHGVWPVAMLSVIGTGVVAGAVLVTVWVIAGGEWVRRCAPFVVLVPYAIWLVTSADSFYTAVGGTGVAMIALGLRWGGRRGLAAGLVAGLLLGWLLFLTYLGLIFAIVPLGFVIAALVRRTSTSWQVVAGTIVGVGLVIGGFLLGGFWWIDGARRTRREYWEGTAHYRTWGYFGIANIAVALIAIGPATFAGLLRLRDRRMWLLVGAALAAIAASHLSQYTRGEVERIWLLFYPWLAIAGGALAARVARRSAAVWLGAQALCAILLQAALVSKW